MPERSVLAFLAVMAIVVAACGPAASSGPGGDDSPAVADVECLILQGPGPGDVPPGSGETDTSNDGPGRWRLCLDEPNPVVLEGTAWCTWDAARTEVDAVSGLPTTSGGFDYDAYIDFPRSGFEIHLTERGSGSIANYGPRFDLPAIETDLAHRSGLAPFEVSLQLSDDVAPMSAPAVLEGRLRWACGDPPAQAVNGRTLAA